MIRTGIHANESGQQSYSRMIEIERDQNTLYGAMS